MILRFSVSTPVSKKNNTKFNTKTRHSYKTEDLQAYEEELYYAIRNAIVTQGWLATEKAIAVRIEYDHENDRLNVEVEEMKRMPYKFKKDLANLNDALLDVLQAPSGLPTKKKTWRAGAIRNDSQVQYLEMKMKTG